MGWLGGWPALTPQCKKFNSKRNEPSTRLNVRLYPRARFFISRCTGKYLCDVRQPQNLTDSKIDERKYRLRPFTLASNHYVCRDTNRGMYVRWGDSMIQNINILSDARKVRWLLHPGGSSLMDTGGTACLCCIVSGHIAWTSHCCSYYAGWFRKGKCYGFGYDGRYYGSL